MKIFNCDAWKYISGMPDKSVNLILTDPLYKANIKMSEFRRICSGNIIVFCDPRRRFFGQPDEVALWMKPPSSKNTSRHLAHPFEEIIIRRGGNNTYNRDGLESANFCGIYYDTLLEERTHEFQKPISLLERMIAIYSNPGDVVFDPFFGSGSTLLAARNLGRIPIGCEINADYFEQFRAKVAEAR